jgi:hypothetical protein
MLTPFSNLDHPGELIVSSLYLALYQTQPESNHRTISLALIT